MTEKDEDTSPPDDAPTPPNEMVPTPPIEMVPAPPNEMVPAPSIGEEPGLIFEVVVEAIRALDDRYAMDAYQFVREALDWQVSHLPVRRHVSGPELLEGVQRLAYERFGPMARTVLNHWGLVDGEDIGRIVFHLIEAGILSKTEDDRLDDFAGVIRFDEVFEAGYRWP